MLNNASVQENNHVAGSNARSGAQNQIDGVSHESHDVSFLDISFLDIYFFKIVETFQ